MAEAASAAAMRRGRLAPPSLVTHRRRHTTLVHEPRALAGLGRAQRNALGAAVSTLFLDYVQQLED